MGNSNTNFLFPVVVIFVVFLSLLAGIVIAPSIERWATKLSEAQTQKYEDVFEESTIEPSYPAENINK